MNSGRSISTGRQDVVFIVLEISMTMMTHHAPQAGRQEEFYSASRPLASGLRALGSTVFVYLVQHMVPVLIAW